MTFLRLVQGVVDTFLQMAPYLLLGLTFAGILHILFKKEFILRHLGKNNFMSSIKAAILGVPLPLCSCGVIPTALSLRKNKASEGATVSFLISTPQTGVDSIIATYGMLGPLFAIFRPVAAFVMGVLGGFITTLLGNDRHNSEPSPSTTVDCPMCMVSTPHSHSFRDKIFGMIRYAYVDFLDDISVQLLIGILISAVISVVIPPDFFERYVGNQWIEMLLMLVGGIPLYVCATASIPIAMALMMKGLSPGAAFVFLAAGPATNAASIVLIANVMGKRIVAIYLGVIAVFSMIAGLVLNLFYTTTHTAPLAYMQHHHGGAGSQDFWTVLFSLIFLIMLLCSLMRKYAPGTWHMLMRRLRHPVPSGQAAGAQMQTIQIEGMTCNHCARHVSEAIQAVSGVNSVNVDLTGKCARVSGAYDPRLVKSAIQDAGYRVME